MISKKIEGLATQLLSELNINELPIPIRKIAELKGLIIHPFDLGANISGVLVIDKEQGTIGINPLESPVRQRFTIAHELGHYLLHRESESLFVDKHFKILFRSQGQTSTEIKKEQDANAFAAAILMPKNRLEEKINESSFDLTDDEAVKRIAQMFDVSVMAMTYRIANLHIK